MATTVLSGARRRWTSEQKARIVTDSLTAGANIASVAREHNVNPNLIYAWRRLARKGCHAVTFSENPAMHGAPTIHSGGWDPVFAAACDEGTILCCHVGSSSKSVTTTPDAPPSVRMTLPAGYVMRVTS